MNDAENNAPIYDDTYARILALASKACRERGILPDQIDWALVMETVKEQYQQGIRERDVNFQEIVDNCVGESYRSEQTALVPTETPAVPQVQRRKKLLTRFFRHLHTFSMRQKLAVGGTAIVCLFTLTLTTTMNRNEIRLSREGPQNRYVVMQNGSSTVYFDTFHGGYLHRWDSHKTQLIGGNPAQGFQAVITTGQDMNQAGANTTTEFRVAKANDSTPLADYHRYYIQEVLPPDWPNASDTYRIVGFYPFRWMSREPQDDALPPRDKEAKQTSWILLYQPGESQAGKSDYERLSSDPELGGEPIWFKGHSGKRPGIIFVGNESIPDGKLWNDHLAEIQEGRVAMRTRISFKRASSDAFAGLIFRREVPRGKGLNLNDAYASAGYFLNVNKRGEIQLLRSDGITTKYRLPEVVWDGGVNPIVEKHANTHKGVLLEIRTNHLDQRVLEIWVEKQKIHEWLDPEPIQGKHVGLIAYTQDQTYIKFSDREVFDMGIRISTTYRATPDGAIESHLLVESLGGSVPFYHVNTVAYMTSDTDGEFDSGWAQNKDGTISQRATSTQDYLATVSKPDSPYGLWTGRADGSAGLFSVTTEATIDGIPSTDPHGLISIRFVDERGRKSPFQRIDTMPYRKDPSPVKAKRVELKIKWWGKMPPPEKA